MSLSASILNRIKSGNSSTICAGPFTVMFFCDGGKLIAEVWREGSVRATIRPDTNPNQARHLIATALGAAEQEAGDLFRFAEERYQGQVYNIRNVTP
jgi:hypothetical protein